VIATLRHDAALYFPSEGPYAGRGKRKKYGKKLDDQHMPNDYLQEDFVDKDMRTRISHRKLWHKQFSDLLNIVVLVKTNLQTQAVAHVV
jgi:putative transposase